MFDNASNIVVNIYKIHFTFNPHSVKFQGILILLKKKTPVNLPVIFKSQKMKAWFIKEF